MSSYREVEFKCVIKPEYREFFQSVIMENKLKYTSDEKVINDFIEQLDYFWDCGYEIRYSIQAANIKLKGVPIYNKDTGECAIYMCYNRYNGTKQEMISAFEEDLLPYIVEGKIEYLYNRYEI